MYLILNYIYIYIKEIGNGLNMIKFVWLWFKIYMKIVSLELGK